MHHPESWVKRAKQYPRIIATLITSLRTEACKLSSHLSWFSIEWDAMSPYRYWKIAKAMKNSAITHHLKSFSPQKTERGRRKTFHFLVEHFRKLFPSATHQMSQQCDFVELFRLQNHTAHTWNAQSCGLCDSRRNFVLKGLKRES